jgi:type I restriction enzyme S subunit
MSALLEGWTEARLGEVCRIVSGSTPKTTVARYWGGEVPWITPDDLSGYSAKSIARGARSLTEEGYDSCSAVLVPPGSVLYTSRAPIGYVAIASGEVCTNQGFKNFVPNDAILSDYLYWYLRWATPMIQALGTGTTFKEVSKRTIGTAPIRFPSRAEQRRIVEVIEEQFSRLDAAEAALSKTRSMVKTMRRRCFSALTRVIASPDIDVVEPSLPLPEGWGWMRASDACRSIDSGSTPKAAKMYPGAGDVPFLKVYNVTMDGRVDFSIKPTFVDTTTNENQLARSRVRPGDVLMNIVGPPLGKVAIVPDAHPEWNINQAIVAFRPKSSLNSRFLAHCLMSDAVLRPLLRTGKATAGQTNLSLSNCRRLWLPIPLEREQERICQEIERQVSVFTSITSALIIAANRSSLLRRAILERAFSGRLFASADRGVSTLTAPMAVPRESPQMAGPVEVTE